MKTFNFRPFDEADKPKTHMSAKVDDVHGKTAVITGATSGIGASFARVLAGQGYDLFLTGRRRNIIEPFAREIREKEGVSVHVSIVDLSDTVQVDRLLEEIAEIPVISFLINNAGFGQAGLISETPEESLNMLMVHVVAAARLTGAVVPRMVRSGGGALINVASVAAFFPMAGNYSATKSYLVSFSESLHMELESKGIHVQALCPGMTRTDFHSRMGEEGKTIEKRYFLNWMLPEQVARLSLRRLGNGRVVYVPGTVNKFLVHFVSKIPRRLYYRLATRIRNTKPDAG